MLGNEPNLDGQVLKESTNTLEVFESPVEAPSEPVVEDSPLPTFETGAVKLKGRALALGKRQKDISEPPEAVDAENGTLMPQQETASVTTTKRRRFIASDDEDEESDMKVKSFIQEQLPIQSLTESVEEHSSNSNTSMPSLSLKNTIHEMAPSAATQEEKEVSIFDNPDELDGILDMNAAFAQMKTKIVKDPLAGEFDSPEGMSESAPELTMTAAQPMEEEEELLYDSDGNVMNGPEDYSSEEEPEAEPNLLATDPNKVSFFKLIWSDLYAHTIRTQKLTKKELIELRKQNARLIRDSELELPVRKGRFNMLQFVSQHIMKRDLALGDSENIKEEPVAEAEDDVDSNAIQISIETKGTSAAAIPLLKTVQKPLSDSEEDILLIVEEKKEEKQKRSKNVVWRSQSKNSEVFRLAQEQARLRRIQEEEDLNHLIEEQKRKKAARKAARKPETDGTTDSVVIKAEAESVDAPKTLKRLIKKSGQESQSQDAADDSAINTVGSQQPDTTEPLDSANLAEIKALDAIIGEKALEERNSDESSESKENTGLFDSDQELPSSQPGARTRFIENIESSQPEGLFLDDSQSMSTVSDSGREAMLPEAATETDAHDELIASDLSDNIPIILELPQSSSMDPKPFAPTITSHMPFGNIQKNLFSTTQDDDVLPLLSGAFQETQLVAAGSLPGMKVARGNDDMLGLLSGHFPTQMDVDEECASKNLPDSAGGSNLSHSDNEAGEIPNEDSEEEASNEESSDQTSLDEEEDVSDADDDVVANPKFLEDSDKEENDPSLDSVKLNGTETQTQDSVPWLPEEPSVPTVPRSVNFVLGMPPPPQPAAKRTNLFVETEADVEDDEFMNFGGKDGEDDGAMDQYDPEFVGEADKEVIEDFGDVIELHRKQMQKTHELDVTKLLHDVTSGNLRKRARRDASGKGFDLDSDEDDEELLRKIRNKHATALVLDDIDDEDKTTLQRLASNPRTAAFAKCFDDIEEEDEAFISSDDDEAARKYLGNFSAKHTTDDREASDDEKQNQLVEEEEAETQLDQKDAELDEDDEDLTFKSFKKRGASKFTITGLDPEEEADESGHLDVDIVATSIHQEISNHCKQMAEDGGSAKDDDFGRTLASERLGIDIFSMVRERRQKAGLTNPKKNSDSLKTMSGRTIESARIYNKASFMSMSVKSSKDNQQEIFNLTSKKTKAFEVGKVTAPLASSSVTNTKKKSSGTQRSEKSGGTSSGLLSLLTRR